MTSLKGKTLFISGGSRGSGLASRNSGSSCPDDQRVTPLVLPIGQRLRFLSLLPTWRRC